MVNRTDATEVTGRIIYRLTNEAITQTRRASMVQPGNTLRLLSSSKKVMRHSFE
jgi:hypothetical protein